MSANEQAVLDLAHDVGVDETKHCSFAGLHCAPRNARVSRIQGFVTQEHTTIFLG